MADEPVKETKKPVQKVAETPVKTEVEATPNKAKNKSSTTKIVLIVVGVVVGLVILGTVASIVLFGALLNKATENVDVNNGEITIKSDDGSTTSTYGENTTLASGFPTDVPIYEPSTLKASTKTGDDQFSAVATTAQTVAEVTNYYKTEMVAQGWTAQYDTSAEGSSLLTFQKANRTASVVISTGDDSNSNEKTGFVVSVVTNQE